MLNLPQLSRIFALRERRLESVVAIGRSESVGYRTQRLFLDFGIHQSLHFELFHIDLSFS